LLQQARRRRREGTRPQALSCGEVTALLTVPLRFKKGRQPEETTMLKRRTLLKGALVAGAYAGGLALAGRFSGAAARSTTTLAARPTEALITDGAPTRGAMTYGDGEVPPV